MAKDLEALIARLDAGLASDLSVELLKQRWKANAQLLQVLDGIEPRGRRWR
jgi:hypothetical protein